MNEILYSLREDWGPQGALDFLEAYAENEIYKPEN